MTEEDCHAFNSDVGSVVRASVSDGALAWDPWSGGDDLRSKLPDELVDELLAGASSEEEIVGPGGLLSQLTKRLVERAMEVELTEHLAYERHLEPPGGAGNTRNGSTSKTLSTEHGPVEVRPPRDRDGSFDPKLVRKRQRRFEGFDEKILALYCRGLSVRDVAGASAGDLRRGGSAGLISQVTDAVMDDARAWHQRPLEDVYPVLSSTRSWSRSATADRCSARRATSRWGWASTAAGTSSGCGSKPPRAPSSGCRC